MIKRIIGAAAVSLLVMGGAVQTVATPAQASTVALTPASVASPAIGSSVMAPDGRVIKVGAAPTGVVAPKGNPVARPAAATKPGARVLVTCPGSTPVCYHYAGGRQGAAGVVTDGTASNLTVDKPFLMSYDYHSLEETSAAYSGTSGLNIVEIGWLVDRSVNAACSPSPACKDEPYLFVFNWRNGVPQCYNGCGFVQAAGPAPQVGVPGGALASGLVSKQFAIQHFGGAWWVGYGGAWAGYFPDSLWTGYSPPQTFVNSTLNQAFFEVSSKYTRSCSDMGNGELPGAGGSNALAGRVGSFTQLNPVPVTADNMTPFNKAGGTSTPATDYDGQIVTGSVRTGRGGGPGSNSAGTASGTKGSC